MTSRLELFKCLLNSLEPQILNILNSDLIGIRIVYTKQRISVVPVKLHEFRMKHFQNKDMVEKNQIPMPERFTFNFNTSTIPDDQISTTMSNRMLHWKIRLSTEDTDIDTHVQMIEVLEPYTFTIKRILYGDLWVISSNEIDSSSYLPSARSLECYFLQFLSDNIHPSITSTFRRRARRYEEARLFLRKQIDQLDRAGFSDFLFSNQTKEEYINQLIDGVKQSLDKK